jgi:hypothetical protein
LSIRGVGVSFDQLSANTVSPVFTLRDVAKLSIEETAPVGVFTGEEADVAK